MNDDDVYEKASPWPTLEYGGVVSWQGKQAPYESFEPIKVEETIEKKQFIQGYALRWHSLVQHGDGHLAYFLPGSIRYPMLDTEKELLFDHDASLGIISTTRKGLVLHADDHGLAMRLHIPDTSLGRKAVDTVRSGERTALSVGVLMQDPEYRDVDGVKVRMVRRATLQEISLVRRGACRPAFCMLVDADTCGSIEQDAKSLRVLSDGAWNNLTKKLRELAC
jgi:HK97 family phage prohead protease